MKTLITVALAAAAFAAAPATAAPPTPANYQFSYKFNTGQVVSGTFSGTPSGNLVTNISSVSLSVDGTPFTGPLFAYGFTGYNGPGGPNDPTPTNFVAGTAVASTDPLQNNFLFANYSTPSDFAGTNYFYILPWSNGPGNQVATQALVSPGSLINGYNGQYVPGNWSLSAAVPEPSSWAMLIIGAGIAGATMRRRRVTAAVA